MNARLATAAVALAAALTTVVGGAIAATDVHKATRGGVFVSGKEADYELVAKPTVIQLYVNDHGKPRSLSKAWAKVTFLTGSEKQEVELKPIGDDRLEANGTFKVGPGTKAIAVVTDGGKTLGTARFTLR